MKTAATIERQEARKEAQEDAEKGVSSSRFSSVSNGPGSGRNPNSRAGMANLKPWPKGVSGNPTGTRKGDTGAQVARAIFETNPEMIYEAFAKALAKGNVYAFQVLADRGYGKLRETHSHEVTALAHVSDEDLIRRMGELEDRLGVPRSTPQLLPPVDKTQ